MPVSLVGENHIINNKTTTSNDKKSSSPTKNAAGLIEGKRATPPPHTPVVVGSFPVLAGNRSNLLSPHNDNIHHHHHHHKYSTRHQEQVDHDLSANLHLPEEHHHHRYHTRLQERFEQVFPFDGSSSSSSSSCDGGGSKELTGDLRQSSTRTRTTTPAAAAMVTSSPSTPRGSPKTQQQQKQLLSKKSNADAATPKKTNTTSATAAQQPEATTASDDSSTPTMITYEAYFCEKRKREFYYNPINDTVQWHAPNVALTVVDEDSDYYGDGGGTSNSNDSDHDGGVDLFSEYKLYDEEQEDNISNQRRTRIWKVLILMGMILVTTIALVLVTQAFKYMFLCIFGIRKIATDITSPSSSLRTNEESEHPPPRQSFAAEPVPAQHKTDDDTKDGNDLTSAVVLDEQEHVPKISPSLPQEMEHPSTVHTTGADLDSPSPLLSLRSSSTKETMRSTIMKGVYECVPESLWEHDVVLPVELTRALEMDGQEHDTTALTHSILARIQSAQMEADGAGGDDSKESGNSNSGENQLCKHAWARRLFWQHCNPQSAQNSNHQQGGGGLDDILFME